MAGACRSIEIDATPEQVFAVITDYEAYQRFSTKWNRPRAFSDREHRRQIHHRSD